MQLWKVPCKSPLLAYINQEFVAIKRNCLDRTPVACDCLLLAEGLGWWTAGSPLLRTPLLCSGKFHCLSLSVERPPHTMNKASGGDGIPVDLFQILKDDAVKVLHSICQQIGETQQWPQHCKRSVFIPIPKTGNAKECSLVAQMIRNLPAVQETWVQSLGSGSSPGGVWGPKWETLKKMD